MQKRIYGIDVNTRYIALTSVFDGKWEASFRFPEVVDKKAATIERLYTISDSFRKFITLGFSSTDVDWVYVEDVPMVRNVKTMKDLQAVVTAVLLIMHDVGVPCTVVNVSTWKRETIGDAKASKSDIKKWAMTFVGAPEGLTEDEYDAAVIAFRGAQAAGTVGI